MRRFSRASRFASVASGIILPCLLLVPSIAAQTKTDPSSQPAKPPAKKKAPARTTTTELRRLLEAQRVLIEEQQKLIAEQQIKIGELETKVQEQQGAIEAERARLAAMEQALAAMNRRLEELQAEIPGLQDQKALEERLRRIEEATEKVPELPPTVVSAGEFPGSIRIPGTDAAIKFGGRIRTAVVFTLGPLGSEDRFLTNSIPVEASDEAAGKGPRTSFSANTSRLNFELRTPTGAGQMRAFIEGDFYGSPDATEKRTAFRLRHAYAQFRGIIAGQTWSTFSDPAADHEDMDFEGLNGENVIRQPLIRYTARVRDDLNVAAAAETPEVSLTGGKGVNVIPDLVGRAYWKVKKTGHLQGAVVLRQIRGESDVAPGEVKIAAAWGASLSGVLPFHLFDLTDRFIFQVNFGEGNARYINDLNSLGGQDAVFDLRGELHALHASGGYLDYEHQWKAWTKTREMNLRSSLIWSRVQVNNRYFQPGDAYARTNRFSVNLVFSPIQRIDVGIQYIWGMRENKDGKRGYSDQFQIVGIFRF